MLPGLTAQMWKYILSLSCNSETLASKDAFCFVLIYVILDVYKFWLIKKSA